MFKAKRIIKGSLCFGVLLLVCLYLYSNAVLVQATPINGSSPRMSLLSPIPDMWSFPDSCIQDCADAGFTVAELKASANSPLEHPNPGGDGVMTSANTYDFSLLDAQINRWGSRGIKIAIQVTLSGFRSDWWPQYYNPPYQAEDGATDTSNSHPNAYISAFRSGYNSYIQQVVSHYANNSNVYGFFIDGPSYYGETELLTTDYGANKFWSYDTAAKAEFRTYLQTVYASLAALNSAWGTSYATWNDVQPPLPDNTLTDTQMDMRRSWSDFVTWRHKFLYDTMNTWVSTAKANTAKPVGIKIGGNGSLFLGSSFSSSMGDMCKMLSSGGHASFLNTTVGEQLSSMRYGATACNKYNIEAWGESNSQDLSTIVGMKNYAANMLMGGMDDWHYCHVANLFRGFNWTTCRWEGDFSKTKSYWYQRSLKEEMQGYKAGFTRSDVAFFQSYYTSWYKGGSRNNLDLAKVYDKESIFWVLDPSASWGRYLTTPDIVDEQMITDDILNNYKVLVLPNASNTVTLDTVCTKIKNWVNAGGYLVTFGQGALTYQINSSRVLTCTDPNNPAYWCMGISGGTAASTTSSTTWRVSTSKPSWLTSLTTSDQGSLPSIGKVFTTLASGAVPVIEDGNGNKVVVQYTYGSGKVLFCTTPVENNAFFNEVMPKIISDFADNKAITRNITFDPSINATYLGNNPVNNRKLVVVNTSENLMDSPYNEGAAVDNKIQFNTSLTGNVDVLQFSKYLGNSISSTLTSRDVFNESIVAQGTLPNSMTLYRNANPLPIYSVSATNEQGNYPAKNVKDGVWNAIDDGFWASAWTLPQTLTLNLGKQRVVNAIAIYPRVGYGPKDAVISVSADGSTYTTVWSGLLPNSKKLIYLSMPRKVKYVRMYNTTTYATGGDQSTQVQEIQVYGPETEDYSKRIVPSSISYSSQDASYPATNVKDLTESTYWKSTASPSDAVPQYVVYDLGANYYINRAEIQPLINYGPKDLDIMVSTNGTSYTPVYTALNNNCGDLYSFSPVTARYVKLNIRSSYSWGDVRLAEMCVYGTACSTSVKEIPVSSVKASSCAALFGGFNPTKTLDGVTDDTVWDSFWVSAYKVPTAAAPAWLVYDFGKTKKVSRVDIVPRAGYGNRDTEVLVSTDGIRYTTVSSYTAPDSNQTVTFGTSDARFVKILIKSSYGSNCVQIKEVSFFAPVANETDKQLAISSISATSQTSPYYVTNVKDGVYNNTAGFYVGTAPTESAPQVITADLGSTKVIRKIAIDSKQAVYSHGPAEVLILASTDGTTYSEIAAQYCSEDRELIDCGSVSARYLKLYMKSTYSPDPTNQINEIKIFGADSSPSGTSGYVCNFDASDSQGWSIMQSATGDIYMGCYRLTANGSAPCIVSPDDLKIDASKCKYIKISMRNDTYGNLAEFQWLRDDDTTWDLSKYTNFTVNTRSGGSVHSEYIIDLSSHPQWKGVIKRIRLVPVTVVNFSGTTENNGFSIDYIKVDLNATARTTNFDFTQAMTKFWTGNTVYNESVLLISNGGGQPEAPLYYTASSITAVKDSALNTLVQGVDWTYDSATNKIKLLTGSKGNFITNSELIPTSAVGMYFWRSGGYVMYNEGTYLHSKQLYVTYTHNDSWTGIVPQYAGSQLTGTVNKLQTGSPLKVVLYGDSISLGCNSSGFTGGYPYMPSWGALFVQKLQATYSSTITLANKAKGGSETNWGVANIGLVTAENPDLVVLAFGMNDGAWGMDANIFKSNIQTMMNAIKAQRPNCEFILVSTTLPRSDAYQDSACIVPFLRTQPQFEAKLLELAGNGVAVARMTSIHQQLLTRKWYADMSGNNINHPTDFLIRVQAQVVSQLLIQ